MKPRPFYLAISIVSFLAYAEAFCQVGISDEGPISPNEKSILEMSSQTKGLLLPRLTTVQMTSIVEAPDGLLIYNTDSSRFYFYSSRAEGWQGLVPGTDTLRHICGSPFYDARDGRSYATVKIGSQCWMAENLRASKYRNGDPIPLITDGNEWLTLTSGAFCWYNNDSSGHENPYGKIYNHYAVSDSRGLCPKRWRVATEADWSEMVTFLGGESVAGGKLKEEGTAHWKSSDYGGTNESGFTGLPGGVHGDFGEFTDLGYYGYFWTATVVNTTKAWTYILNYGTENAVHYDYDWKYGWSVRCVRD